MERKLEVDKGKNVDAKKTMSDAIKKMIKDSAKPLGVRRQ